MTAYTNHCVTQMSAFITKIRVIECVMPQMHSLSRYICVCTYMNTNSTVYVLSVYTYTYVWVKYDLKNERKYISSTYVESYYAQK